METVLFQITFKDGRMFKVFCANRAQKERIYATAKAMLAHDPEAKVVALESGIHDITQWEQIVNSLKT